MKVSIITTVFNNKNEIEHCLQSVYNQSYTNIEHIVVDGGSTDGTLEILALNRKYISHLVSEPDKGIYDAINKGLKLATGEVIGILHSDDLFFSPNTIAQIVNAFEITNADGVYGNLQYVDKTNPEKIIRHWQSKPFAPYMLKQGWMPPHPTLFMTKQCIEKTGVYSTSYRIAADYDFMLRTLTRTGIRLSYIPEVITRMRVGGASNKSVKNIIRKSWEDYLILRRNKVGGFFTLFLKNVSKIGQFFKK